MTEDVNSNTLMYTYNKCGTPHEISFSVKNWVLDIDLFLIASYPQS
jgi:hypothetical protein